ncbi:phage tail protein [Telmatospirillum siberiense]|nr:tail fiber protein [Telmatospirillum siberiense]
MAEPYIGQVLLWAGERIPNGWHVCDGTLLSVQNFTALFSIIGTRYGGNGTSNFAIPDLRSCVPFGADSRGAPIEGANNAPWPVAVEPYLQMQLELTANNIPQHIHGATFAGTGGGGSGPLQASGTVSLPFSAPTTVNSTGTAKIAASTLAAGSSSATANAVLATTAGPPAKIYATGTPDTVLGTSTSVSVSGSATVTGNASGTVTLPVTGATGITGGSVTVQPFGLGYPVTLTLPTRPMNYIIAVEGLYPSYN